MDAAQLRQAYEVLLAEAETGGFGPPPPGEWTAEQVVAHVAANDELLIGRPRLSLPAPRTSATTTNRFTVPN